MLRRCRGQRVDRSSVAGMEGEVILARACALARSRYEVRRVFKDEIGRTEPELMSLNRLGFVEAPFREEMELCHVPVKSAGVVCDGCA